MITFRNVLVSDFNQMYNWLQLPHVKKFWYANDNFTFEETYQKYDKRLNDKTISMYIIQIDNIDIGFIQSYFIENTIPFRIDEDMVGIDLYIGDTDYHHKNHGKDIIKTYVKDYIFIDEQVNYVGIDPEIKNKNAIKAYKKAGFEHVNTEFSVEMKKMTYYMVLRRDKIHL